ncbi:MAG: hypothetical protein H7Y20_11785, partial [Bryobacteraceae bacterium]|nr:hypothetical protein [Bryobacteraceae bacterium]
MKWLKIAAAVVAAIIVIPVGILLAIGLRPDAGRLKVVSEIHKRPSQVWPWLREGDRLKLWVGWLKEVRETNPAGNKQIWVMEDK